MWVLYAMASAFFAGITAILAKCGIRKTDSTVATALRTGVVLAMSWVMVFLTGSQHTLSLVDKKSFLFLGLSGLATGASWLCYFYALKWGNVNKVAAIDRSSTVLTILLAFLLLGEPFSLGKGVAMALIALGTLLMLRKQDAAGDGQGRGWLAAAAGSAVFASLTAILSKVGIQGVESNLATALRTGVVLLMAWAMVFATGKQGLVRQVERRELGFICLSGLATGASWLCYYKALQDGVASVVVSIDKMSILVSASFARAVFGERLGRRAAAGLAVLAAGTMLMAVS